MSATISAPQLTKAKTRKVSPLGKLLATYNELLGAWIVSGLPGHMEVRKCNTGSEYQICFCGHEPVGFASIAIYTNDQNFEQKKNRILDYLMGEIDYLDEESDFL